MQHMARVHHIIHQVQFIDALHQNEKPREIFIEWAICFCGWKYFFSLCAILLFRRGIVNLIMD